MYKIIILAMIINISSFANIINSNYISKTHNISCNISFDPSNNNFKYYCKNIKIYEILLKDLNGFTIARKTVDRPFDGYGTFNNINGRPSKISCYVIYQNKIVEISNLKNIEYSNTYKIGKFTVKTKTVSAEEFFGSSSNKPSGQVDTNKYPKKDKKGNYYRIVNSTRVYYPN